MKENNKKLKFAVIGCGFWAEYQLAAWMEFKEEVEVVALYNRTLSKARKLAEKYNIPHCYDDLEKLLTNETLDFVDIITDVTTHAAITKRCADHGIPVICQKPMGESLAAARSMLQACRRAGVPLMIHENFRWQRPVRKIKELLDANIIGSLFKAKVSYCSAFPVFKNQPSLAELDHFILTDIGSHILDVCRFLFGEVKSLYCQTATVNPSIKGEDVANVVMTMKNNIQCFAEMSYASILESENFPQTLISIEGAFGSVHLLRNFEIKVITREGISTLSAKPQTYDWVDPLYLPVHSSIVDCNRNMLNAFRGKEKAETTGEDNMKTVLLVWAAYRSAEQNEVINMATFHRGIKADL